MSSTNKSQVQVDSGVPQRIHRTSYSRQCTACRGPASVSYHLFIQDLIPPKAHKYLILRTSCYTVVEYSSIATPDFVQELSRSCARWTCTPLHHLYYRLNGHSAKDISDDITRSLNKHQRSSGPIFYLHECQEVLSTGKFYHMSFIVARDEHPIALVFDFNLCEFFAGGYTHAQQSNAQPFTWVCVKYLELAAECRIQRYDAGVVQDRSVASCEAREQRDGSYAYTKQHQLTHDDHHRYTMKHRQTSVDTQTTGLVRDTLVLEGRRSDGEGREGVTGLWAGPGGVKVLTRGALRFPSVGATVPDKTKGKNVSKTSAGKIPGYCFLVSNQPLLILLTSGDCT